MDAREHLDRSLALAARHGFGHELAAVPQLLALLARDRGDLAGARRLVEDLVVAFLDEAPAAELR